LRGAWQHELTRRLALRAHVGADVLATTTRFDVDHMTVWESPRAEASAGIAILAHFP